MSVLRDTQQSQRNESNTGRKIAHENTAEQAQTEAAALATTGSGQAPPKGRTTSQEDSRPELDTPYQTDLHHDHYFFHNINTSTQLRQAQERDASREARCWTRFKRWYQSMLWHQALSKAMCGARRPCRTLMLLFVLVLIGIGLFAKRNVIQESIAYTRPMPGVELASIGFQAHHPIVLVPGIVSTGLELWQGLECAQNNFRKRMWGSTMMLQAILLNSRCWLQHLKLNQTTGLDPDGIRLRPADGLEAADYLLPGYWIWARFIEDAAAIGYDTNNLHLMAYDWRLDFFALEERDGYFTKLKAKIELTKRLNRNRKVVLVAHSMGVLVIQYFFSWVESPFGGGGGPSWVEDHIDSFVMIGAPHLGVPKAVSALMSGEMRDTAEMANWMTYLRRQALLSNLDMAGLLRGFRSLPAMLPKGGSVIWGEVGKRAPDDDALSLCQNRYQSIFSEAAADAQARAEQRRLEEEDYFTDLFMESKHTFDSLTRLATTHFPSLTPFFNTSDTAKSAARLGSHALAEREEERNERNSLAERLDLLKMKFSDYANQATELIRARLKPNSTAQLQVTNATQHDNSTANIFDSIVAHLSDALGPYAELTGEISPALPAQSLAAIYRVLVDEQLPVPRHLQSTSNVVAIMPEAEETLDTEGLSDYLQLKRDTKRRIRSALNLLFRHKYNECANQVQNGPTHSHPFNVTMEMCEELKRANSVESWLKMPDEQLQELVREAVGLVKDFVYQRQQAKRRRARQVNLFQRYGTTDAKAFDHLVPNDDAYSSDVYGPIFDELYEYEASRSRDLDAWEYNDGEGPRYWSDEPRPSEPNMRQRFLNAATIWAENVQMTFDRYRDLPVVGYPAAIIADGCAYQGIIRRISEVFAVSAAQVAEFAVYAWRQFQTQVLEAIFPPGRSSEDPSSEFISHGGQPLAKPGGGMSQTDTGSLRSHVPQLTDTAPSAEANGNGRAAKPSTVAFVQLEDRVGTRRLLDTFSGSELKMILVSTSEERKQEQARAKYESLIRKEAAFSMLEEPLPKAVPRRNGLPHILSASDLGVSREQLTKFISYTGLHHSLEEGGAYNATGLLALLDAISPQFMARMRRLYEFEAIPREEIERRAKLEQSPEFIANAIRQAACHRGLVSDPTICAVTAPVDLTSTDSSTFCSKNSSACHQAVILTQSKPEPGLLNTTYIFDIYKRQALIEAQRRWANPLAVPLPRAPSMKLYALYGVGKPAERGYVYRLNPDRSERRFLPYVIDSRVADPDSNVRRGVRVTDGDGTVPLISLGYMCAEGGGWDPKVNPHLNPSGIKCIVREFANRVVSPMDILRITSDSADHVDIIGNTELIADVLKIAGRFGPQARRRIEMENERIAKRKQLLELRKSRRRKLHTNQTVAEAENGGADKSTQLHETLEELEEAEALHNGSKADVASRNHHTSNEPHADGMVRLGRPRFTTVSGNGPSREARVETEKYEMPPDEEGRIELLPRVLSCINSIAKRIQLP